MTEPPAKRPRRTDSAAMWDAEDKRTARLSHTPEPDSRRGSSRPDDHLRAKTKDENRRYRSRTPDRYARRRDRSRSHDRDRDRDRNRDGGKRDSYTDGRRSARDRDRSSSRDRLHARRGTAARSRDHTARDAPGHRDSHRDTGSRTDHRRTNGASRSDYQNGGKEEDVDDVDDVDRMSETEDPDDIEALMRKAVGFTKFRSTKNTKVPGNNIYGVRKEKKTEYRQYMNRVGGFNRPLSPGR